MNFNFLERFKSKVVGKEDVAMLEKVKPFVDNFEKKMLEMVNLLKISDHNSSQDTLTKIESGILVMRSDLEGFAGILKSTTLGDEYFSVEEIGGEDSLSRIQQDVIFDSPLFKKYSSMAQDLKSFENEAMKKLMPESLKPGF